MRTDEAQPISAHLTESENRNRQKIFKSHVNYNEFSVEVASFSGAQSINGRGT